MWLHWCRATCVNTVWPLLRCAVLLFVLLHIGNMIAQLLPISLPGSIIGMFIFFFLLVFQIIPVHWVKFGCHLIIKYMTLFFIPATMGILDSYIYLIKDWMPILFGTLLSTFLVFVFIALLTEHWKEKIRHQRRQRR